jgi:hypothetical protein
VLYLHDTLSARHNKQSGPSEASLRRNLTLRISFAGILLLFPPGFKCPLVHHPLTEIVSCIHDLVPVVLLIAD